MAHLLKLAHCRGAHKLAETETSESEFSLSAASHAAQGAKTLRASARLRRRIASAVSVTSLGSVLTMGLSTLASIAVARNGGPARYGNFVAATVEMILHLRAALTFSCHSCRSEAARARAVSQEFRGNPAA